MEVNILQSSYTLGPICSILVHMILWTIRFARTGTPSFSALYKKITILNVHCTYNMYITFLVTRVLYPTAALFCCNTVKGSLQYWDQSRNRL